MTSLPRTLGLRDLIFLTIGSVIGSGIFLVPGGVLRQTGGFIIPALLVWLLFIAAAADVVLNTIITQPARAGIALSIVLLGAPAYLIWRQNSGDLTKLW